MANYINVTQSMFFRPEKIIAAMDKKTRKVMERTGAYGRKVMQRGMRKRKKVSTPGEYPSAHEGSLRRLIYFGYEEQSQAVVVGPTLFSGSRIAGGKTVPQLLNKGGTISGKAFSVLHGRGKKKKFVRVNKEAKALRYRPRPFVELAQPATTEFMNKQMEQVEFA